MWPGHLIFSLWKVLGKPPTHYWIYYPSRPNYTVANFQLPPSTCPPQKTNHKKLNGAKRERLPMIDASDIKLHSLSRRRYNGWVYRQYYVVDAYRMLAWTLSLSLDLFRWRPEGSLSARV